MLDSAPRVVWASQSSSSINVWCIGNSRTIGLSSETTYPAYLTSSAPLSAQGIAATNKGLGAAPTSTQAAAASGQGNNNLTYHLNAGDNIVGNLSLTKTTVVLLNECINELYQNYPNTGSGATAVASCFAAIKAYCDLLRSGAVARGAALRLIVSTEYPSYHHYGQSTGDDSGNAVFQEDRLAVNSIIRCQWGSFADGLCDIAADPRFLAAGITGLSMDASGLYYPDKTHPNSAGYAVVAAQWAVALRRVRR